MLYNLKKTIEVLNETERYFLVGAVLVLIISSILFGISLFYKKTVIAPVAGGSFTEGIIGQPIFINPLIAEENKPDLDIIELVFSGLLDLAEKYTTSEEGKIWTVILKPDLKWSNGEPLTSDDVVFTIEAIQDKATNSPYYETWQGVIIERISEREVKFVLRAPYAFFSTNLRDLKIIPRNIFSNLPLANLRLSSYNLDPVSSGPYKFKKLEKRKDGFITKIQLETNPYYAGEKPLITEFNFKFYPNYEEAVQAFNKREIDGLGSLNFDNLKGLMIGHQVFEFSQLKYYAIFFNPNLAPSLKEREVRSALALATNQKKIVSSVLNNRATEATGPLFPEIPGYDFSLYQDKIFSLDNASSTLESAGWKLNKEGIREKRLEKKNILSLDFKIVVPEIQFLIDAINIIKEDWQKIGVKLDLIILSLPNVINEAIATRNYQMIIFGNSLKDNADIFSFWHSSQKYHPGLNLALYENKASDELLEAIRKDFNEESRNKNLSKLQENILKDRPAIFLFSPHYFYAVAKDLKGIDLKFIISPSDRFKMANKWYLKTARVFK